MTQEPLPVLEQQQVGPVEDMLLRRAVLRSAKIVSDGRFVTKQAALDIAPPLPVQEPVAYDKTEMNSFVIDLYDKKMQEGKHGHYEIMFHVVHQAIKRVTLHLPVQPESVTWDKPSDNFNEWWDGDRRRDKANPFDTDSFAYWAWEGWQAALQSKNT